MRVKTFGLSERDLMFAIAGQLFDQAPNREPRNVDIIMRKVRNQFRTEAHNDNEWYVLELAEGALHNYVRDILMAIPEFVDLNLSLEEVEAGIGVVDNSRAKFSCHSRYDINTPESWKSDFIDLDAFTRNVSNIIIKLKEADEDCFGCKYEGTNECTDCMTQPKLCYKYDCARTPKGNFTFSCKFDCPRHYMICCEECKNRVDCKTICDGNSDTCGNVTLC